MTVSTKVRTGIGHPRPPLSVPLPPSHRHNPERPSTTTARSPCAPPPMFVSRGRRWCFVHDPPPLFIVTPKPSHSLSRKFSTVRH
jgi:hypothetical protein